MQDTSNTNIIRRPLGDITNTPRIRVQENPRRPLGDITNTIHNRSPIISRVHFNNNSDNKENIH